MTTRLARVAAFTAAACCVMGVGVLAAPTLGIRVNISPSVPRGIYHTATLEPSKLAPGQTVTTCTPRQALQLALARGYVPALRVGSCPGGTPFLFKMIAGLPGDVVNVADDGVRVNGVLFAFSAPKLVDENGAPMPRVRGTFHLRPDQYWLYGPNPLSFDSRYFGPANRGDLLAEAQPLWIEGTP